MLCQYMKLLCSSKSHWNLMKLLSLLWEAEATFSNLKKEINLIANKIKIRWYVIVKIEFCFPHYSFFSSRECNDRWNRHWIFIAERKAVRWHYHWSWPLKYHIHYGKSILGTTDSTVGYEVSRIGI